MANLKLPKPTVIRTFTLQANDIIDPPSIQLELASLSDKDKYLQSFRLIGGDKNTENIKKLPPAELIERFGTIIPIVSKCVVGWDLIFNGEPLPCTDVEKAGRWWEDLLWKFIEPEASVAGFDPGDDEKETETGTWFWSAIMEIISDRRNFLKN